jgi:hypothetical protein
MTSRICGSRATSPLEQPASVLGSQSRRRAHCARLQRPHREPARLREDAAAHRLRRARRLLRSRGSAGTCGLERREPGPRARGGGADPRPRARVRLHAPRAACSGGGDLTVDRAGQRVRAECREPGRPPYLRPYVGARDGRRDDRRPRRFGPCAPGDAALRHAEPDDRPDRCVEAGVPAQRLPRRHGRVPTSPETIGGVGRELCDRFRIEHEVVAPTRDHVPEFDFTRLGPRVPAVAISPWIEPGSVFGWNAENPEDRHTFDHTSVLATVGEMTGVHVDSARARRATPLSVTLNRMTARTDASRLAFRRSAYHGATAASRRRPRPSAAWGGSSATASASSTVATRRRRRSPTTTRTWSVPDVPVRTLATDHRARASDRAREAGPVGMRLGEVRGLASDRQGGARAPSGTTA